MFGASRTEVAVTCRMCHQLYTLAVDMDDFKLWEIERVPVQRAFVDLKGVPYLSDGERELLVSQTCDACWASICSENAEDTGSEQTQ